MTGIEPGAQGQQSIHLLISAAAVVRSQIQVHTVFDLLAFWYRDEQQLDAGIGGAQEALGIPGLVRVIGNLREVPDLARKMRRGAPRRRNRQ